MSSSTPKKNTTPVNTKKTPPLSNQKKPPAGPNSTDPKTEPTPSKAPPKPKTTPAMAAVARKMATKPAAGAIMKKPSAPKLQALPSMKTGKPTPTTGPTTTAQKSPNPVAMKRSLPTKNTRPKSLPKPMGGGAKRPFSQRSSNFSEVDDYDYEDDFIDNTEDNKAPINLSSYLKELGFYKGPTSLQTYRVLDPHYDPAEMEHMEDDGDDCVEVNSFTDLLAMDAKTAKSAIEEDKREREEEKRQLREEVNKRKRTTSTPTPNTSKKKKTS
jgi:hypothetical protein